MDVAIARLAQLTFASIGDKATVLVLTSPDLPRVLPLITEA